MERRHNIPRHPWRFHPVDTRDLVRLERHQIQSFHGDDVVVVGVAVVAVAVVAVVAVVAAVVVAEEYGPWPVPTMRGRKKTTIVSPGKLECSVSSF
jgi:cobalamin biosynthesis protein CobD/CbiB